jgi:outer membrane protein assembly factor BamB
MNLNARRGFDGARWTKATTLVVAALLPVMLGARAETPAQSQGTGTRARPVAGEPRPAGAGANWLVWGGTNRNFLSTSTGLADAWPATGPRKLWSRPLGEGYSGAAVEGDRLYTMYRKDSQEVVAALRSADGTTIWEYAYESPFDVDVGPGPYAMPQVVGNRIVTAGSTGKLHSIDKNTGKPVWSHDVYREYGGSVMRFGYSCHALPFQDLLIVMVGGSKQALMAFRQADGSVAWGRHRFPNSHSSPLLINVDGQTQVVALMGQQVAGMDPATGDLLWQHAHPTQYDLAISTPVWGPDNILVVSSSYEGGTRALHLSQAGGKTTVKELWHNPRVRVHFGSMIRLGDTIYASSGHDGPAPITAFDVKTGKVLWNSGREFAKSQLLSADGKLIVLDQDGVLALASVSPSGIQVRSKVELLQKVAWTPPTLAGTTLFIRDRHDMMALALGK